MADSFVDGVGGLGFHGLFHAHGRPRAGSARGRL